LPEKTFDYTKKEYLNKNLTELTIPDKYIAMHQAGFKQYIKIGLSQVLGSRIKVTAKRKDKT
jgi:hypothetical protein